MHIGIALQAAAGSVMVVSVYCRNLALRLQCDCKQTTKDFGTVGPLRASLRKAGLAKSI